MNKIWIYIVFSVLVGCSGSQNILSVFDNKGEVCLKATVESAEAVAVFSKTARRAVVNVSADDMISLSRNLTITTASVEGRISGIPVGKSRLFVITVYDSSNTLQYKGAARADVSSGVITQVPVVIQRIRGSAIINGTIVDDTSSVAGYRFYKFEVNAADLGGAYEVILTETHFIKNDTIYPQFNNYSILSSSSTVVGNVIHLFDGSANAAAGYVKFTAIPWSWIIDVNEKTKFDSFYLSSWETWFYKVPSSVTVYGSDFSDGPWNPIGTRVFDSVYQETTIPLVY